VQVVRGSPSDVLDVLMNGSVNTTILGPARTVEVLQCIKDDKTTKEVLRIEVEAPGWAGTLCAPREVLLERVLKMDDVSAGGGARSEGWRGDSGGDGGGGGGGKG